MKLPEVSNTETYAIIFPHLVFQITTMAMMTRLYKQYKLLFQIQIKTIIMLLNTYLVFVFLSKLDTFQRRHFFTLVYIDSRAWMLCLDVFVYISFNGRPVRAIATLEGLLALHHVCVQNVISKHIFHSCCIIALVAFEGSNFHMDLHVLFEILEFLSTNVTFLLGPCKYITIT